MDEEIIGLKAGGFWLGNPQTGLSAHQSTTVMFDPRTGLPTAFMDGNHITTVRTAAVGALAARVLAPEGARVAAILGLRDSRDRPGGSAVPGPPHRGDSRVRRRGVLRRAVRRPPAREWSSGQGQPDRRGGGAWSGRGGHDDARQGDRASSGVDPCRDACERLRYRHDREAGGGGRAVSACHGGRGRRRAGHDNRRDAAPCGPGTDE